jgi:hypothetical protein
MVAKLEQLKADSSNFPELYQEMKYRAGRIAHYPIGNGFSIIYNFMRQESYRVPSQLINLVNQCNTHKTISDHARDIYYQIKTVKSRSVPNPENILSKDVICEKDLSQIGFIEQELHKLATVGILVSEFESLIYQKHVKPEQVLDLSISTIGIVTCNRPESLERCLNSYIQNVKNFQRKVNFVVFDDSKEVEVKEKNKDAIRKLMIRYGVEIYYAGLEEKVDYARALAACSNIPLEIIEFALLDVEGLNISTGANRNALLLHTSGELLLSVDDDTICEITEQSEAQFNVRLDLRSQLHKFKLYDDRTTLMNSVISVDKDILQIHEQLLGKKLSECIDIGKELQERSMEPFEVDLLLNPGPLTGEGKVLMTFNSIIGDSGTSPKDLYFFLEEESRVRAFSSESAYHKTRRSREVFRGVCNPTINYTSSCVATVVGLDNRETLPPFPPAFRNQDGVFGLLVKLLFKDSYSSHLPSGVLHFPVLERFNDHETVIRETGHASPSEIIKACLMDYKNYPEGEPIEGKFKGLGMHLMNIGMLPSEKFQEFLRLRLFKNKSDEIAFLEKFLSEQQDAPEYWARDIKDYIRALRNGLTEDNFIIPERLLVDRSPEEALKLMKNFIYKFGQLLHCWPELVQAAKEIKERGITAARLV